jgi:hypothetical protein
MTGGYRPAIPSRHDGGGQQGQRVGRIDDEQRRPHHRRRRQGPEDLGAVNRQAVEKHVRGKGEEDEPKPARPVKDGLRVDFQNPVNHQGVKAARTNSEWLGPRWQVKFLTASPNGTSTSRSGSRPQIPPYSNARQPACLPSTASPTAAAILIASRCP